MRLSCRAARFSLWKGEMTLFFLDTEAPLSIGEQLVGKLRELWQGLMQNGGNILWNLLVTAVILLIAKFALQAVSSFTGRAIQKGNLRLSEPQKKRSDTMMTLLRSASRYLIYFVALLLILRQFGFGQTINNLLVTAGIGSLAIGFGAQVESRKDRDVSAILKQVQPQDLLKFGIIPELVGRLPVITALQSLGKEQLVRILTEPKNALVKQYQKLLAYDNVEFVQIMIF